MSLSHESRLDRIDAEAARWTALLEGGEMSPAQHEELESWLAADDAHLRCFTRYQYVSADAAEKAWALAGDSRRMAEPTRAAAALSFWRPWTWGMPATGAAVAACLLMGCFAFWMWPSLAGKMAVATSAAQRRTWTLADGTRADLNARTHVSADFRENLRRVRMDSGEAMFSVEKDESRPFVVETPAGSIRVTGTVFNVRLTPMGPLEVTVLEGSVMVDARALSPAHADPLRLQPGDQLTLALADTRVRTLAPADLEHVVAWKKGRIVFDAAPLTTAVARLAEYHGRSIFVDPEIASLRLGGSYSLDNLQNFFGALEDALPVRIEHRPDGSFQVMIRPRGR